MQQNAHNSEVISGTNTAILCLKICSLPNYYLANFVKFFLDTSFYTHSAL